MTQQEMPARDQRKLRVAIVGAGYVAQHHLAALSRLPFVELVGVCDSNVAAAQAMAARFGIERTAPTLGELIEAAMPDARPDAVHVLTPPASHRALAIEAMQMGCHVLVEKPMADTVADCQDMILQARTHDRVLGVNHSDLLDPMVEKALSMCREGRIGQVLSVDIVRNSEYPAYAGGPLPATVTQGSYPFRDLGVHGLYTIQAFLGDIESLQVDAQARGSDPNLHFDEWQAHATTATGVGRLLLSWNGRPMENRLVVRGTSGTIDVDRFLQTCQLHRNLPGPKFIGILANGMLAAAGQLARIPWNILRFATGRLRPSPGIQHGATLFAQALHYREAAPFSGEDALKVARLIDAACQPFDQRLTTQLQERVQPLAPADALVTGAGGFVGRALVAALRARGQTVRVLLRRPVPALAMDPGIQVVIGDLGDPAIVDHAVAGAPIVYHVGAAMRGGPRDFEAGTTWGTRNIVEACLAHHTTRLVYVSSLSVLDHAGRDPARLLDEQSAYEPHPGLRGAYTQTKLAAERLVREAIETRGLPAAILRPGQIFGPGAERTTPNGTVAIGQRWVAVGDGARTLPLVYLDDAVDALLLAGSAPGAVGRVFNIVDPVTVGRDAYLQRCASKTPALRILHVPEPVFMALASGVELLGKLLRREVPLTRYRVRSLRPLANFDTTAAREVLGWRPSVGVARGMDITFGVGTEPPHRIAVPQR